MRQQINLFQDVLVERKPPLNAVVCLGIFVLSLLLVLASSLFINWLSGQEEAQLARLQETRTQLAADLQTLKLQYPPRQKDPLVARELERLQKEHSGRQTLLAYLDQVKPGRTDGFSSLVEGLARYPLRGVWLTDINFDRKVQKVQLAGSATHAELVPAYLKHLGDKQVLAGQTFARLNLARIKESGNQVNFSLVSEYGETN